MPILSTVITGALAAAITNYAQKKQFIWREKETRQAEIRQQREAFVAQLMNRVSTRVYTLRKVIEIMATEVPLADDEIKNRIADYNQSVKDTLVNFSTDLLLLTEFFSQEVSDIYANQVMFGPKGFVKLENKWLELYSQFKNPPNIPQVPEGLLKSDKINQKQKDALISEQQKLMAKDLFVKKMEAKNLRRRAITLGNKPIGVPFYKVITKKVEESGAD